MEDNVLQRIKENLLQRKQELVAWLKAAPQAEREYRAGPGGQQAVQAHMLSIDAALQQAEDKTLGRCTVCQDFVDASRLEMDYTASICIVHLSDKDRTLLENELELSQKVQRALLPHKTPSVRGLDFAAFSQPAHIVGGDYFDFLRLKDGSAAILIADVMGKGMPASMLMASLQASLRIIVPESNEPAEILQRVNRIFCHNIRLTKFVTLFLGRYDEETRTLTYANAGHNPPAILRSDGCLELLPPTGAAIGLIEQTQFGQASVRLGRGDRAILYTDGVVESSHPEKGEFGVGGLENLLRSSAGKTSQQTISPLRESLLRWTGSPSPVDDTTVIAMTVVE